MICHFSACFQATEVRAGILDARAYCLLLAQTQMMEKLHVFSTMARKCACSLFGKVNSLSWLFCHSAMNWRMRMQKKLRLSGSLGKNPIWSRSQRSLWMRFCSSHARKVDVDYWLLSALLVGCNVNNIKCISYILFLKLFRLKQDSLI